MNYNNFACRLAVPRLSAAVSSANAPKAAPKKTRKTARRRLTSAAAALWLIGGVWSGGSLNAAPDGTAGTLCLVPASDTVPFTGFTSRSFVIENTKADSEEQDLATRIDALSAQVNALTAQAFQTATTTRPPRISPLTASILCLGLGLALFQARLLVRSDIPC